jgi:hypothetical protein
LVAIGAALLQSSIVSTAAQAKHPGFNLNRMHPCFCRSPPSRFGQCREYTIPSTSSLSEPRAVVADAHPRAHDGCRLGRHRLGPGTGERPALAFAITPLPAGRAPAPEPRGHRSAPLPGPSVRAGRCPRPWGSGSARRWYGTVGLLSRHSAAAPAGHRLARCTWRPLVCRPSVLAWACRERPCVAIAEWHGMVTVIKISGSMDKKRGTWYVAQA